MGRTAVFALAAALLALPCLAASSGEWASNAPATQRFGLKYGDYLKNKGAAQQPPKPNAQRAKKKNHLK